MIKVVCIIVSTCSQGVLPALNKCIRSLRSSANFAKVAIMTVVVTENSKSDSGKIKDIDLFIRSNTKKGFGFMNNLAIKTTWKSFPADYYLLINDDAWLDKNFFREFSKITTGSYNPDIIIPLIYLGAGHKELDAYGIEYLKSGLPLNARSKNIETQLFPAAALLLKKKFIEKVIRRFGFLFNTILFYYLEDVELSIRFWSLDPKVMKSSRLIVNHIGQNTTKTANQQNFVNYYSFRNMLWVIIISWPRKIIIKNILKVLIIQSWLLFSKYKFKTIFWNMAILIDTGLNIFSLMKYRSLTIAKYPKNFNFENVFSEHFFYTRKEKLPLNDHRDFFAYLKIALRDPYRYFRSHGSS